MQVGLIGIIFFLGLYFSAFNKILTISSKIGVKTFYFGFAFLVLFFIVNFSESLSIKHNNIFWIIFTMLVFKLNNNKNLFLET